VAVCGGLADARRGQDSVITCQHPAATRHKIQSELKAATCLPGRAFGLNRMECCGTDQMRCSDIAAVSNELTFRVEMGSSLPG
jgi:hypothetical protein